MAAQQIDLACIDRANVAVAAVRVRPAAGADRGRDDALFLKTATVVFRARVAVVAVFIRFAAVRDSIEPALSFDARIGGAVIPVIAFERVVGTPAAAAKIHRAGQTIVTLG